MTRGTPIRTWPLLPPAQVDGPVGRSTAMPHNRDSRRCGGRGKGRELRRRAGFTPEEMKGDGRPVTTRVGLSQLSPRRRRWRRIATGSRDFAAKMALPSGRVSRVGKRRYPPNACPGNILGPLDGPARDLRRGVGFPVIRRCWVVATLAVSTIMESRQEIGIRALRQ